MLSAGEILELKLVCAPFGRGWRAGVQGHFVEEHIPEFVDLRNSRLRWSRRLHSQDTLLRRIVPYMRNPGARHQVHALRGISSHGFLYWSYEEGDGRANFQQEAAPHCHCRCC